jgi:hypothetical protein
MPFSSENLLKQLDQPGTIDWAPELKIRKEAFEFMVQAIEGDQLNQKQFLNALHMIPVPKERVLELWRRLIGGDIDGLLSEPWRPGYTDK